MAEAAPGEILTTSVVRDLIVGSNLALAPQGVRQMKGLEGPREVFALAG